jgi:hypothetical protein
MNHIRPATPRRVALIPPGKHTSCAKREQTKPAAKRGNGVLQLKKMKTSPAAMPTSWKWSTTTIGSSRAGR